ncbi:MAG: ribosome biogenesis GTP-binding protein YihA/YsxC [Patescibacteria group bacterium]|nr:ribosome biogenesis GTP-binding protein YihA/YsxC [Patescibacteria group bacterium]
MIIKSAEFIKGITGTNEILRARHPQIVFIGRSNVGKSSVINSLVKRSRLVKSASRPGKTLQINFFLINRKIYFVDLPGYGFMKISLKQKEKIRKMIIWYLFNSMVKFKKVVLIIDAKVGPSVFDIEMLDLLRKKGESVVIVANKTDKLKQGEIKKQFEVIKSKIGEENIILYSAKTNKGREELLEQLI